MTTAADVVVESRKWANTPWHHQARVKGVGVDCAGLIIGVAHALGLTDFDIADYGRQPDPIAMGALLREHLDELTVAAMQPGDILWLRVATEPQHLAIVTQINPTRLIHALSWTGIDKVVETLAGEYWTSRIIAVFRFRGLA